MITIINGPMWSGKTTKLVEMAKQAKNVVAFDCFNSRNTNRDLHNIITCKSTENIIDYKDIDLVIFDEVHLVDVYTNPRVGDFVFLPEPIRMAWKKEFFAHVRYAVDNCDVAMSGLLYDCYHDYNRFPIWADIDASFGAKVHCKLWLDSLRPCCECGTDKGVIYTKPISKSEQRVGDHYDNVCVKCARETK